MDNTLEELERDLKLAETESDSDLTIDEESMATIRKRLRLQHLAEFHALKESAIVNKTIGNDEMAKQQFEAAKLVLKAIKALDQRSDKLTV